MRRTTTAVTLFAAFGLLACDSATAPVAPEGSAAIPGDQISALEQGLIANSAMGVERAEFVDGFCFFVVFDVEGVVGFSGESQAITTNSGVTNYHCKGDVLFGELSEPLNLRGVTFTGEITSAGYANCHVRATAGPNGQASVSCHEKG